MKTLVLSVALILNTGSVNVLSEPFPPRKSCEGTQFQLRVCADKNLIASDAKVREVLPPELANQWVEATSAVCEERWQTMKSGSMYPMKILICNDTFNRVLLKEFVVYGRQ